jgi:hypothetical protein
MLVYKICIGIIWETHEWYPYDQCASLLDKHNYVSFANPSTTNDDNNKSDPPPGMLDPRKVTDDDIKNVKIYYDKTVKCFKDFPYFQKNEGVKDTVKDYFSAVGKELAETMILNVK